MLYPYAYLDCYFHIHVYRCNFEDMFYQRFDLLSIGTSSTSPNFFVFFRGSAPSSFGLANALVFKKVRGLLGLDRCKFCLTGAAPITRDTLDFFMSLNVPLMELFGMSESTGPHTVNFPWRHRITSVGPEMMGATTKLADADKDGNGEV